MTEKLAFIFSLILRPLRFIRTKLGNGKTVSLWTGSPIITLGLKAKAERLLGVKAASLVYSTYYISSSFDYNLSSIYRIPLFGKLIAVFVLLWACVFVDRFHFYCDRGLIPSLRPFRFNFFELYLYKHLGIDVFFWTYGADVRSMDATQRLGQPNCCTNCSVVAKGCICDEQARLDKMSKLKKLSKAVFSMGDMIEYTPQSRNDLFFWPIDLNGENAYRYTPRYPAKETNAPLRIVHAPNHRMFKGTQFLMDAVNELKAEGCQVELELVEKVPNDRALEIYRTADIIFDQCLIGFHGYFALEGMAMGKPVMCFIRKPSAYLLKSEECPMINTHVNTLKEDIRYYIDHRELLNDIGVQSRRYIEKYFTLEAFAERLKKAYQEIGVKL